MTSQSQVQHHNNNETKPPLQLPQQMLLQLKCDVAIRGILKAKICQNALATEDLPWTQQG